MSDHAPSQRDPRSNGHGTLQKTNDHASVDNTSTDGVPAMQSAPVLFTIFNRPEQTLETFRAIRAGRPSRLYVSADGPRPDRPADRSQCLATRDIIQQVDWDCEVFTLFRDQNVGCKRSMAEGISWFFENEPAGIVIEDDCVADRSFFRFCTELLQRYADDKRIGMISGINHYGVQSDSSVSYHFSRLGRIWGWASWRDRWALYSDRLDLYGDRIEQLRATIGETSRYREMFFSIVDRDQSGQISTWDCYWELALHANHLLTIRPRMNLVSNIGFGDAATHTSGTADVRLLRHHEMPFPIVHPAEVEHDARGDRLHERSLYPNSWPRRLARVMRLRRLIQVFQAAR